jgi:hypothetical protein
MGAGRDIQRSGFLWNVILRAKPKNLLCPFLPDEKIQPLSRSRESRSCASAWDGAKENASSEDITGA